MDDANAKDQIAKDAGDDPTAWVRKETRDYVLDVWKLKADQRLRMFHFFVLVYGVIAAGLLTYLKDSRYPWVAALGGLLLAIVCWVFWRLDSRSRKMLHESEEILRAFEELISTDVVPAKMRLFTQDKARSEEARKKLCEWPLGWLVPLSFYDCFRWIFGFFGVAGFGLAVAAICIQWQQTAPNPPAVQNSPPLQQNFFMGNQAVPLSKDK